MVTAAGTEVTADTAKDPKCRGTPFTTTTRRSRCVVFPFPIPHDFGGAVDNSPLICYSICSSAWSILCRSAAVPKERLVVKKVLKGVLVSAVATAAAGFVAALVRRFLTRMLMPAVFAVGLGGTAAFAGNGDCGPQFGNTYHARGWNVRYGSAGYYGSVPCAPYGGYAPVYPVYYGAPAYYSPYGYGRSSISINFGISIGGGYRGHRHHGHQRGCR